VTVLLPDAADLAVLGMFGRRLEEAPVDPRTEWRRTARPDQLLPPISDPWRVLLLTGGRGSGKSRSGAQGLAEIILSDTEPEGQYGICAPTYRDAWTVDVEGESGLLRAFGTTPGEVKHGRSRLVEYAHRSYGEIGLRSGHIIYVDSADDGALRIQGKNLRSIWADEIGLWTRWQVAWDESIRYAVRKGAAKIIATGTPKVSRPARALMRRLLRGEEPGVIVRRLRTVDNAANLSEAFYQSVIGAAKGTRLERQELEGELLDDVENALWTLALLERIQVPAFGQPGGPQYLWQAKVGVDPSDGTEDSDEQAYTVIGKGAPDDPHLYVAESWGGQEAPAPFAKRCVLAAVKYDAELVVEKNHGGEWLRPTFEQAIKDLAAEGKIPEGRRPRVRLVAASKGKRSRAEPVSAMYERDIVRHCKQAGRDFHGNLDVHSMVELEDQMCIAAGQIVTTSRGDIPVEEVRAGDRALTRYGWRRVYRAGLTGVKPTVEILTDNGSVICTQDHPVYVSGYGFIRADEVQSGDSLVSCREPLSTHSSSTTASGTTGTSETATTRPAAAADAASFTVISGKTPTGRSSRRAGTSTTGTMTGETTTRPTSRLFQPETITAPTARAVPSPSRPLSAALGARRSGSAGRTARTPAPSAGTSTGPGRTSRQATAPTSAATAPWAAVVQSVHASGVRLVYDLSVEDQPEFFAGGLLVHNCTFTGADGERSPDRLDSLVWAATPFLNVSLGPPGASGIRKWAGAQELADMGASEETKAHKRMREIQGRAAEGTGDAPWGLDGLDGFAPADGRDLPTRGNVRSWR